MPTITELPVAAPPGTGDELPIAQNGATRAINVGDLLATTQPAIVMPSGTLLGRSSVGGGGPEPITAGSGLALSGTTLAANGADHADYPTATTLDSGNTVVLNTAAGPAQLPVTLLRTLFTAGSNIAIDADGTISASTEAGPQGAPGPAGAAGANGSKWWTGSAAPAASLGVAGDLYLNTQSGGVFAKGASGWSQIADLAGPQGAPGAAGAAGPAGAAGLNGATWWTGSAAPAAAQGAPNDLYLNVASGQVFQKSGGNWTQIANLAGPPGPPGKNGAGISITDATVATTLNPTDRVGITQNGTDQSIMSQTLGSQLSVVATIGKAQTTAAVLADRFGDMPNVVRDFGAPTNGADAAAAINAAIAAIKARGGGYVTIPNIGKPFMLSAPIVPQTGVHLLGHGMPILQLLPGANSAVIESAGFEADIATLGSSSSTSGGVYDCSVEGLVLDGNSANQQKTVNIDFQNGISMYGSSFKLRRLQIQNILGHGIRTGWGAGTANPSGLRMAPSYEDITVVGTGRNGWWNQGPHDSFACNVLLVNASLEANGGFYGFWNETSGRFVYVHYWSNTWDTSIVNFPLYAARSEGWSEYIGCHFESANQCFLANGAHDKLTSCLFYNPTVSGSDYSALVDVNSYGNQFTGCYWANVPPAAGKPGLKRFAVGFVNTNGQSNSNTVSGFFRDFDAVSPFNLTHDAGANTINGTGYATSTVRGAMSFVGTQAPNTLITYSQDGVTGFSVMPTPTAGSSTGNQVALCGGTTGQSVALVASGMDANVGIALVPKQGGALSAAVPDGAVGGAARGANAVDWQTLRSSAAQVASGGGAAIGGGTYNTAAGYCAAIPGGAANTADANYSVAGGIWAHTHGRYGSRVYSSGNFSTPGDCQKGDTVLRAVTTDASLTRATADGYTPNGGNTIPLQPNSAMTCRVRAIARDSYGNCAYFVSSDVLVGRGSSASATYMAGGNIALSPMHVMGTANGWSIYLMADQYWGGVAVFVTGANGETIHWQVDVEFLEVV